LRDGKLAKESFYSMSKTVNRNTVFQVASLSKLVSTIGVMKLVQDGKLNLDAPASGYLKRWKLPEGDFDNSTVTIRKLLSHTAGLTDGLGYAGFETPEDVQPLEASLSKAKDADPGSDGIIMVGVSPGKEWRYSGGGFTLLQLIVEEVSGQSFDTYMAVEIFEPLQMTSSFYQWDETYRDRLCNFYNLMRQVEAKTLGAPIYGLGTFLYTEIENGGFVIGHDGKNNPPINTAFRYNPVANNGIIILTTGSTDFATRISSDWVFIQTGKVDALLFTMQQDTMIRIVAIGLFAILILVISIGLVRRKSK